MANPFSRLRKPAWEHRDPARRAEGVAQSKDPELLRQLPDLVREDPDVGVRLAALRRIDDLALLADRMRHDEAEEIRALARERYAQGLLDPVRALADRERLAGVEEDAELLALVARQAPEASLRRIGLERSQRHGLLVERCLEDPDPELRHWLLERITDIDSLDRIAEQSRRRDKHLFRAARERARDERLLIGDPQATRERALEICDELDRLRRDAVAITDAEERAGGLREEWLKLKPNLDGAMERRVNGYFEALAATLAGPPPEAPEAVAPSPEKPPKAPRREPDLVLGTLLAELETRARQLKAPELAKLEERWRARCAQVEPLLASEKTDAERFQALAGKLRRDFETADSRRQAALGGLPARVEALEAAVEDGQLAAGRELQARLAADRTVIGSRMPRQLGRRIAAAEQELRRLARWQNWSSNKLRMRLIRRAEELRGSGLHPDAIAARVQELRERWRRLDEDGGPRQAAGSHPLHGRFHATCQRALAPASAYFEKRHELREERAGQFEHFIGELEQRLQTTLEIRELLRARRQVIDRLRRVDDLEPAKRGEASRRLRALLEQLKTGIQASESEGEAAKRKLLAGLRRDLMHVDLATALPLARQAQSEWKTLPRAGRRAEDALWAELRELVDPWFDQADARRREERSAADAVRRSADAILAELAELATADAAVLLHVDSRLDPLRQRWRELAASLPAAPERPRRSSRPPRRQGLDERAFDAAVKKVFEAHDRHQAEAQRAARVRLLEADARCTELASLPADAPAQRRAELLAKLRALELDSAGRAAVERRMEQPPTAADPPDEDPAAQARELVVAAELALGMESPHEDQALRRRLQIERLSERLSGQPHVAADELHELLLGYVALAGVPAALRQALTERWQAIVAQAGRADASG